MTLLGGDSFQHAAGVKTLLVWCLFEISDTCWDRGGTSWFLIGVSPSFLCIFFLTGFVLLKRDGENCAPVRCPSRSPCPCVRASSWVGHSVNPLSSECRADFIRCVLSESSYLFQESRAHHRWRASLRTRRLWLLTRRAVRFRFLAQSSRVPSHLSPHAAAYRVGPYAHAGVVPTGTRMCFTLSELTDQDSRQMILPRYDQTFLKPALDVSTLYYPISPIGSVGLCYARYKKTTPHNGKASLPGFTKRSKLKKRISASKTVKNGQKSSFLAIFAG